MGLLDQIGSGLSGKLGGTGANNTGAHNNSLVDSALSLISNSNNGGLTGLLETFKQKGLGSAVSSWVSPGANQPVSGAQIQDALGPDKIQHIASKAGVTPDEASTGLAGILPQVIDKLTPNGSVPDGGMLEQGIGLLKNMLTRH